MMRCFRKLWYCIPLAWQHRALSLWSAILRKWTGRPFTNLSIELNRHCNRKCWYCPNSKFEVPVEDVSKTVFDCFLDQLEALKWDGYVQLHHFNEPLLAQDVVDKCRCIKAAAPRCKIRLFTNGDLLTLRLAGELIEAGVVRMLVCKHAPSCDEWDRQIAAIMHKYSGVVELLPSPSTTALANIGGLVHVPKDKFIARTTCEQPKFGMTVTVNGDVVLCCHDYARRQVMGNICQQTLENIWNGCRYVQLRDDLAKGDIKLDMCKQCLSNELT